MADARTSDAHGAAAATAVDNTKEREHHSQSQHNQPPLGVADWATTDYFSGGVFGSTDGRARSTSGGSTVWRSVAGGGLGRPVTSSGSGSGASEHSTLTPSHSPSSDLAQRLAQCTASTDAQEVDDNLNALAQQYHREQPDARLHQAAIRHVPRLLAHYRQYIRARTYRLLRRQLLQRPRDLHYCRGFLELCLMHALSRGDNDTASGGGNGGGQPQQQQEEREQALKYIRWTMRFAANEWLLTAPVLKAMMAVAEQVDDRLRGVCLETLCECLVRAPRLVWYVGGLRTLTQAALDGPWAVSVAIASALAHTFDRAESRAHVHVGLALGGIVSALTESPGKDQMLMERAKLAAFMLTQLLKSWGGLQYFLADGRRAIRALVQALSLAGANAKIILGMLLELFGLSDDFDAVQFDQQGLQGLQGLQAQPRFDVDLLSPFHLPPHAITQTAARTRLLPVDYMRTLLLTVFIEAGLVEALVEASLSSQQPEVVEASATLLKWLAQHPHMPLAERHVARFQTLGALVAAALKDGSERALAARRIVGRIDAIPSLSTGQLPSQQTGAWAASLASSTFYRQHLRQMRMRRRMRASDGAQHQQKQQHQQQLQHEQQLGLGAESAPGTAGVAAKAAVGFAGGSSSLVGGSKGLAAGLKDNAVRVLRSSASTGNLKQAAASAAGSGIGSGGSNASGPMPLLTTVTEDSPLFRLGSGSGNGIHASDSASIVGSRSQRSLDIVRSNHPLRSAPQQQMQMQQIQSGLAQFMSAISAPYAQSEQAAQPQPLSAAASMYSQHGGSTATLSAPPAADMPATPSSHSFLSSSAAGNSSGGSSSLSAGALPLPLMSAPAPPLLSRTRTKSRSRSRNSIVIVNSLGQEEPSLAAQINGTRVLSEDNPLRWDWDAIRALILGPISAASLAARRLPDDPLLAGFLSRLSLFFHPATLEFCDLSRTPANEEYLEIGRQLIRILISSADGLLLIEESRLLPGIVDEVRRQIAVSRNKTRDDSCFSFARLQMTMSPGYFHFLAEVERTTGGDALLERNRLFDAYYQAVELPDQVLLIQYILSSMSYRAPGHARNILRKVAVSPHEPLRLLVPSYLLYLTSDVACGAAGSSVTAWAIEVLVELLYDPSPVVRSTAAQCLVLVLDLPAENPYLPQDEPQRRITCLLDLRPMFELTVITDIRPLILRLIGTEQGFAYLRAQGIVESEMDAWGALEGIYYVQSVELDISRALAFGPLFSSTPDGAMMMTTTPQTPATPAHLFGELVKCAGGRAFLQDTGIPGLLFETLANIPWNSELPADVSGLKATLWAIGAMGASKEGFLLLEPFDVLARVTEVAREATSMSIKGTCLYALGLLSRSQFAAELFRERGWLLCASCHGAYEYAVPRRIEALVDASDWAAGGVLDGTYVMKEGDDTTDGADGVDVDLDLGVGVDADGGGRVAAAVWGSEDLDSVQREIIESIVQLGNHVKVTTASKTLMRLRTSHPHYFRILPLYQRAMWLLGKYRYRLATRRFIYNIFDVNLATLHELAVEALERSACGGGGDFEEGREVVEVQRKRASTLQEYPAQGATVFAPQRRRPTGALLEDIRLSRRISQQLYLQK
ncbi:hypothetical protein LPJ53_002259 [Coemansia erecta]|uniref:ARM repeat-containing protein n=1 Tax=Coemansia erecta TaxID=147472 RepID=A0A9W7Y2C5_9FUNG|nr:hypothetical protein LPJ53_002259 [Coemansia erecta]